MDVDRASATPSQLYHLAADGKIDLSPCEKDRLSPDFLFVLALTNKLQLTGFDRVRIRPLHLAHLAVAEKIELEQTERDQLPVDLLFDLVTVGATDCTGTDEARMTMEQVAYLNTLASECHVGVGSVAVSPGT